MKSHLVLAAAVIFAMTGTVAFAQDRGRQDDRNRGDHNRFNEHDQQVTRDWYNQHQSHPPAGLREHDRLSAEEENRLREGEAMDHDMRRRVHTAPPDLYHRLPPPPQNHRYVTIGGHVVLIDHDYQVRSVIHLHDNH